MSGLHRSSSSSKNVGNCLPSKIKSERLFLVDSEVMCVRRFVLNVPEEDQQSFKRILDGKEQARAFPAGRRVRMKKTMPVLYVRQQRVRLYIVAGMTDDTSFAPQTKKEISEIA
ncbi:mRNA-decapping enzyme subunit 2 [Raphanus sativus]|nr:mRNA-decapping enzyme subunit 2 [Raphanus sativus]